MNRVQGPATPSPDQAERTLVLMRHAKSAYPPGVDDHERPLNSRGIRQATQAGAWLRDNVGSIDVLLCSTAARTRATLARTGVHGEIVKFSDRLYDSTPGITLAEINAIPDNAITVLVVGHEPTTSALALALADADSSSDALARISVKFPTSAMAILTTRSPWSHLELGGATLTAFQVPR